MKKCLSDELIQAYVEGRKDASTEAHLAACRACRTRVANLALATDGWEAQAEANEPAMRRLVARHLAASRRGFRWWVPATAAAALFVAILLYVSSRPPAPSPGDVVKKPKPPAPKVEPRPEPPPAPERKPEPPPALNLSRPEAKPEPPPTPPKTEAKPEPKPEPKPEVRPEPPKPKVPEPKPEPPPPPKTEAKPEPKPEPKPAEAEIATPTRLPARIEATAGAVRVLRKGGKDWERTGSRAELAEGDRVKAEGGARVLLPDRSTLALNAGTDLALDRIAFIPHHLSLASGEVFAEAGERDSRLTLKTGAVQVVSTGATFHVKAGRDDATVTVFTGEAECRNDQGRIALEAGTQLSAARNRVSNVRKVGTTVAAGWAQTLMAVHFMDEFEGPALADAWDERGVEKRFFDVKIDKSTLACRSGTERAGPEWRGFTLWTRKPVKVEGPVVFETYVAVDRVGPIMPQVQVGHLEERSNWRFSYTAANKKDSLDTAGAERGEKELWSVPSGFVAGQPRKVEFILDSKEIAFALDGGVRYRGPHGLKDVSGVVFGVGQAGRADGRAYEARFDRVRIAPLAR